MVKAEEWAKFFGMGKGGTMKISNWEQLIGVKLVTKNKLYAKVEKESKQPVVSIYAAEDALVPIVVIDWMPTLKDGVDMLRKFGFDIKLEEPFNLVEFLKESIEPKEFEYNEKNYTFCANENGTIETCNIFYKILNCKLFKIKEGYTITKIESALLNNNVNEIQLTKAMKNLGWI